MFREKEVSLIKKKFMEDTIGKCLHTNGISATGKKGSHSEMMEKCKKEANKKWEEVLILNTES
jgi:hypothetical protein